MTLSRMSSLLELFSNPRDECKATASGSHACITFPYSQLCRRYKFIELHACGVLSKIMGGSPDMQ